MTVKPDDLEGDEEREEHTVRESLADLQKAIDDDDLGGATVATRAPPQMAPLAPPQRPSYAPPQKTPQPSTPYAPLPKTPYVPQQMAPYVPQQMAPYVPPQTPPYGMPVPYGTPHEIAPIPSGFDETILGVAGHADEPNATEVASASYDIMAAQAAQAAQAMMFGTTAQIQSEQPPPQPPARPSLSFRPAMTFEAEPVADTRLARLQALSLERPAVSPQSSPSSPRRGAMLPWILLAIVVVGGGIYHVRTVRKAEQAAQRSAPAVAQASPTGQSPSGSLLASGYIAAKSPITLSATMSGRLQDVSVVAGDTITKGQLLARISDGNIRAELSLAAARVRDASRQHQRMAMLVKAQAATAADLERSVGAVEVARAEMRVIEQKLQETRIKSPINGTVLEVLARPGESLTTGQNQSAGILRIADLSALIAEVDIAEAELKNVRIGQSAEVTSEAQRGRTYHGVVREIAEQADRARGTVLVKIDMLPEVPEVAGSAGSAAEGSGSASEAKPPPTTLRPGMAVQVRFVAKDA